VPALAEPLAATVRRQVTVPLRFPDGYATRARVVTFDGLVDGEEHVERLGVTVTERVPTGEYRGPANAAYLAAKAHHFTRSPVR
jgi:GTP cyclohydrolase II